MIGGQTVLEIRSKRAALTGCLQKISDLMNECVLIANLQTGHPPILHVGMITVGDVNALPSAQTSLITMIEELQTMEVV
jgi:hypothetical protein